MPYRACSTMIQRNLEAPLRELAEHYPVVAITGPRQSGKTTLCKAVFGSRLPYVSLEPIDARDYASRDPRGFLQEYSEGAIIDEVQRSPDLLSYLQGVVDDDATPGFFVLTGSQHFGLTAALSQSLAGRVGLLHLLPPGFDELQRFDDPPSELLEVIWSGAYPRIHDRGIPADMWIRDYFATYVQRDVRQVLNVTDLEAFSTFVALAAGRTATEVNLSRLGGDAGIRHNTARAWLSVLEASFLVFRAPAWHRNLKKQQIKAPKLHFLDSGLACYLLGIRTPEELRHHSLRGQLFESWVAAEIYKSRTHAGLEPRLTHFRDAKGSEVDLVLDTGARLILTEVKSGATVASDFFRGLTGVSKAVEDQAAGVSVERRLVYGGSDAQDRSEAQVVPWNRMLELDWA
jgi:uncharacterized protein